MCIRDSFYGVGGMLPGDLDEIDADAVLGYEMGVVPGEGSTSAPSFVAADLTGDGAAELLVAMEQGDTSFGESALYVVPGGSYTGEQALAEVTTAVISDTQSDTLTSVAAVDGASGPQIFIGQGMYREGLSESESAPISGRASWLNLGGSDGESIQDAATASYAGEDAMALGWASAFGDMDGDGTQDAVISAPLTATPAEAGGAVAVLWDAVSHLSGTSMDLSSDADATVIGGEVDGHLGAALALMGDHDGDGVGELLITEAGAGGGLGTVWVVSGGALTGGLDSVADVALLGIQGQYTTANTGNTLAAADFDGDGLDDIVISADGHPTPGAVGLVPTGRVSIFLSGSLAD